MKRWSIIIVSLVFVFGCSDDDDPEVIGDDLKIESAEITLNPNGITPLAAQLNINLNRAAQISIKVEGRNGPESDVEHQFSDYLSNQIIPILGLYPDHDNTIQVSFHEQSGELIGQTTYTITTGPALDDFPDISVVIADRNSMMDGMTLVSYYGHDDLSEVVPQRPFIFDSFGDIRWYLDTRNHPTLSRLFHDVGVERLQNGNLYFGDAGTAAIYEMTMLGEIVDSWGLQGYWFHHNVIEIPNGNFILTAGKNGSSTIQDYVIEVHRTLKTIVTVWDLNLSLDNSRTIWSQDQVNWFHGNAIAYDSEDDAILVSGRHQGLFKLSRNNELIWIMAPHEGWSTSGNGLDMKVKLLNPLDADGSIISNQNVKLGYENHSDFEWNWYQHAPQIMPNRNVMLFDNGDNRNFRYEGPYSRAVEYKVDDDELTIQQVWSFGKERGNELYSRVVSDVDYIPSLNRVFFSSGSNISDTGIHNGKVIELDYSTKSIFFEATLTPDVAPFDITLHRTERLTLYP